MYHDLKNAVVDEDKVYILTKFFAKETPDNILPHLQPDNYKPIFRIGEQIRILSPEEWFNFYGYPCDYDIVDISGDTLCEMVSSGYCYASLELVANCLQKGYMQYKDKYANLCPNLNYVTKKIGDTVIEGYNFKDGVNLESLQDWLTTYLKLAKQANQFNLNFNGNIPQNMMINIHTIMNGGIVVSSIDDHAEVNLFYNTDKNKYEKIHNINFEAAECVENMDNYCYYLNDSINSIQMIKVLDGITVSNFDEHEICLEIGLDEDSSSNINIDEEIKKVEDELRQSKKRNIKLVDNFNKIVSE
jgi:hypothetical protein